MYFTAPTFSDGNRISEQTYSEPDLPTSLLNNLSSLLSSPQLPLEKNFDNDDVKPSPDIYCGMLWTLTLSRQGRHMDTDDLYQNVKAQMDLYKSKIDEH